MKEIIKKVLDCKMGKFCAKHSSLCLALLFSALLICLYIPLSFHNNIWYDEAYQMILNRYSFSDIIFFVSKDFSPPLYALCLKVVTSIFGSSLLVGRVFSLLIYCIAFFLAFFPVKKLFGIRTSLVFAVLLILIPISSYISLEIRTYCFAFVFSLGAVIYSLLLLKENTWKSFSFYCLFSILATYSHNYSIFFIFFLMILTFIGGLFVNRKAIVKILLATFIIILCFSPWFSILINQKKALEANFWIKKPTLAIFFQSLYYILGTNKIMVLGMLDIIIICFVLGVLWHFKTCKKALYIVLPSFCTLFFFVTWSIYRTPAFVPRYIIPVFGPVVLFLAILLTLFRKNYVSYMMIILLIVPFVTNYKSELLKASESELNNMLSYIDNNMPGEKYFFHLAEYSIGEIEYYFPNSHHYFFENAPIYMTIPKLFGDVHKLGNNETLLNSNERFISVTHEEMSTVFSKYNLEVIDWQKFATEYQGKRYVYVLKNNKSH